MSGEAGNDTALLREMASAYEKVSAVQGGSDNSIHGKLISLSNLGDTKSALESLLKAQAIREQVCSLEPNNREARQELAMCYSAVGIQYLSVGPPEKVVESERGAIPLLETLGRADPANEDLQYQLWAAYVGMSKALGNPAVPNLGDTKGALEYKNKAQLISEKLVAAHLRADARVDPNGTDARHFQNRWRWMLFSERHWSRLRRSRLKFKTPAA